MVTKPNNSLLIPQNSSSFKDQNFLSLVILGLIFAIYLTIYRLCPTDINNVFVQGIIYLCFFIKFYQKQNQFKLSSSLSSRATGFLLIFLPLLILRARLLLSGETFNIPVFDPLPYITSLYCITSVIGYILLIGGVKGIKQFQQELIFLGLVSFLIKFMSQLLALISVNQSNHNFVTDISGKLTTFYLWYLGFNPINEGSIIHLNGTSVDIYLGCTGWNLFFILLQLSFCVLFLFHSSLKNNFLPFLLAFSISFILSIIRLIIMTLVVKDDAVFDYWHVGNGSNLFTTAGMILFWGIIFFKLPSSLSFDLPSVNFRVRPHPFLLTVSVILTIIFLSFSLFFSPIAGVNQIASYKFPAQLSLTNWQLVERYPSSLTVKNLNSQTYSTQEENSETEDLGTVLANQIYHYKHNNNLLTIKALYIVDTLGDTKNYYTRFQELSQLENAIEKQTKDGSSFYFINGRQSSLTACVNYQGKTTVTSSQFARSLYKGASNNFQISHLLNWLMGKTLLDKRCLLLEASIDSQSSDRDAQLMSAWTELVSYWQKNFPPLRN